MPRAFRRLDSGLPHASRTLNRGHTSHPTIDRVTLGSHCWTMAASSPTTEKPNLVVERRTYVTEPRSIRVARTSPVIPVSDSLAAHLWGRLRRSALALRKPCHCTCPGNRCFIRLNGGVYAPEILAAAVDDSRSAAPGCCSSTNGRAVRKPIARPRTTASRPKHRISSEAGTRSAATLPPAHRGKAGAAALLLAKSGS